MVCAPEMEQKPDGGYSVISDGFSVIYFTPEHWLLLFGHNLDVCSDNTVQTSAVEQKQCVWAHFLPFELIWHLC
jgi:hypothetical protein